MPKPFATKFKLCFTTFLQQLRLSSFAPRLSNKGLKRMLQGLAIVTLVFLLGACSKNSPPGAVNIRINPQQVTLAPGARQSFTATVTTDSSDYRVAWTATGGTVEGSGDTGIYTAPSEEGSYTLTATSEADTSKKATANITVRTPSSQCSSATLAKSTARFGEELVISGLPVSWQEVTASVRAPNASAVTEAFCAFRSE